MNHDDAPCCTRQPTVDELAGITWWNSLTELERVQALEAAGWQPGGTDAPSVADAWAVYKQRAAAERTA